MASSRQAAIVQTILINGRDDNDSHLSCRERLPSAA